MTLAEVAPFVIVTNASVDFCLSVIVAEVGKVIEEEISFTEKDSWLYFMTTLTLAIVG